MLKHYLEALTAQPTQRLELIDFCTTVTVIKELNKHYPFRIPPFFEELMTKCLQKMNFKILIPSVEIDDAIPFKAANSQVMKIAEEFCNMLNAIDKKFISQHTKTVPFFQYHYSQKEICFLFYDFSNGYEVIKR